MKLPAEVFAHHSAVVGKTGSGKTSTAKLMVEHVAAGSRVCILDPIKSDWWGLISSADGKRPGLPFHILGGPHGHVPLHETSGKAIGELVASGALPLSIIDMADFRPGGLQKFFSEFAAALLRNMRGVVYLVIEEAHEFAPKERAGLGDENLSIHWAKKLATAGRSKGIRLILVTQRTQSLHNALLGSCETVIAHRLTLPADQKPVADWLKANMDKITAEKVIGSMASLKTGCGWVCSGEAKIGELIQFPRIKTYDNSATPTDDADRIEVKSAPVDQERLRAIIGDAVKEAEANDPKALRAEIARLKREVGQQQGASDEELDAAHAEGFEKGKAAGQTAGYEAGWCAGSANAWSLAFSDISEALKEIPQPLWKVILPPNAERAVSVFPSSNEVPKRDTPRPLPPVPVRNARPAPRTLEDPRAQATVGGQRIQPRARSGGKPSNLPRGELATLKAIAQYPDGATREQLSVLTGYKRSSRDAYIQRLKEKGLIDTRMDGIQATADGIDALGADFEPLPTGRALQAYWLDRLPEGERAVLQVLIDSHPGAVPREEIDNATNYKRSSRDAYIQRLKSRQLVVVERDGVRASDHLFGR